MISIHALREEGDPVSMWTLIPMMNFYPRPPRGGRRRYRSAPYHPRNFYPRPPRGGRQGTAHPGNFPAYFYPRPPRGGRLGLPILQALDAVISIHALREEGDHRTPLRSTSSARFLSTPSARRATVCRMVFGHHVQISIHALREEGDPSPVGAAARRGISIHALREEGDARPLTTTPCS